MIGPEESEEITGCLVLRRVRNCNMFSPEVRVETRAYLKLRRFLISWWF